MISVIWIVWFVHQFLILIILLNFLIAIVSGSYEDVMSKESEHKYMHRTEMNLECFVMLNKKCKLPDFRMLILAIPKEGGNGDEMKDFIDKRNKQLSEKIFHQMKEDRELT
jgi:hypothetical protein